MKPRTIFYLVILLSSIVHIQSSCVKNHPDPKPKELPPITTEGRNTIGFLLNGEVWLPGGGGIGHPDKEFVLDTFSNIFIIGTYFDNRTTPIFRQELYLKIHWPSNDCIFGIADFFYEDQPIFLRDVSLNPLCQVFGKMISNKITISNCDLVNKIISGTFELTIENACGDVYEITEGRFDARFRYF